MSAPLSPGGRPGHLVLVPESPSMPRIGGARPTSASAGQL